ncbi:sulfotransferase domain-containing protein [Thermococcus onnurineus]|uniref:sulfotransferase domain-containing protein n=1 Tax=Thermococcus onnurineus TaxID=342948 RepID=UPI00032394B6|nr:sulfotransferase domain-containing protein [Thermococcus onnurineus]
MESNKSLPNFFIVGEPRSGTTSLYHYLRQHPEIFMSWIKEPNYFCKDFHEEVLQFFKDEKELLVRFPYHDYRRYVSLFQNATGYKVIGEASVIYLYSKVAAQNIYEFNPESKILAVFREPSDFLYSLYHVFLRELHETIGDFKKALDMEPLRKQGKYIPKYVLFPSMLYYSEWPKYSEQLSRYYKYFDPSQVKVIIFDDLKSNLEKTYREILQFLGVSTNFIPKFKVYNSNSTYRFPVLKRFIIEVSKTSLRGVIPERLRKLIWREFIVPLNKLNMKPLPREPLPEDIRFSLMKQFKSEITRLGDLIGRDLELLWGYENV